MNKKEKEEIKKCIADMNNGGFSILENFPYKDEELDNLIKVISTSITAMDRIHYWKFVLDNNELQNDSELEIILYGGLSSADVDKYIYENYIEELSKPEVMARMLGK